MGEIKEGEGLVSEKSTIMRKYKGEKILAVLKPKTEKKRRFPLNA